MTWMGAGKLALVGLVAAVAAAPAPHAASEQAAKPATVAHAIVAKYGSPAAD